MKENLHLFAHNKENKSTSLSLFLMLINLLPSSSKYIYYSAMKSSVCLQSVHRSSNENIRLSVRIFIKTKNDISIGWFVWFRRHDMQFSMNNGDGDLFAYFLPMDYFFLIWMNNLKLQYYHNNNNNNDDSIWFI